MSKRIFLKLQPKPEKDTARQETSPEVVAGSATPVVASKENTVAKEQPHAATKTHTAAKAKETNDKPAETAALAATTDNKPAKKKQILRSAKRIFVKK